MNETAENPKVAGLSEIDGAPSAVRLAAPLRVEFERDPDDGGVIAFAPGLRITGTGGDAAAALADLETNIQDIHESLRNDSNDALTDDAPKLKASLARILEDPRPTAGSAVTGQAGD